MRAHNDFSYHEGMRSLHLMTTLAAAKLPLFKDFGELAPVSAPPSRLRGRRYTSLREVVLTFFRFYPRRTVLAFSLMAAQAFFYNAIFFTYALD
jgi:hypothetical protein